MQFDKYILYNKNTKEFIGEPTIQEDYPIVKNPIFAKTFITDTQAIIYYSRSSFKLNLDFEATKVNITWEVES